MGCDVHCHVEVKINGEWHHYNHPRLNRNYQLFSKMAGVRGDEKPIAKPRGIPADATFMTKFDCDYDGVDGHTHSWLSDEEVAKLVDWINKEQQKSTKSWYSFEHEQLGYLFGNGWDFRRYPTKKGFDGQPEGFEAARLVFWFDN